MGIPKGYSNNFKTMLKAAKNGHLALMECQDKKTMKRVFVVCMVNREEGDIVMAPVAKLFDGNPYEELNPPDPDNPKTFLDTEASC